MLASLPDYNRKHVAQIRGDAAANELPPPKVAARLRAVRMEFDRLSAEKKGKEKKRATDDVALAVDAKPVKPKPKKTGGAKLDVSTVKCYGCGQMGHFAKDGKCDPSKKAAYEASKPVKSERGDDGRALDEREGEGGVARGARHMIRRWRIRRASKTWARSLSLIHPRGWTGSETAACRYCLRRTPSVSR